VKALVMRWSAAQAPPATRVVGNSSFFFSFFVGELFSPHIQSQLSSEGNVLPRLLALAKDGKGGKMFVFKYTFPRSGYETLKDHFSCFI